MRTILRRSSYRAEHPFRLSCAQLIRSISVSAKSNSSMLDSVPWQPLGTPERELTLSNTLPTGQSFRWYRTKGQSYTGVVGERVVQMKQDENDVYWRVVGRGKNAQAENDLEVLTDYFNLGISLTELTKEWAAKDEHYAFVNTRLQGCRMMRQAPVECLFQFICSSNNHISRIHGMVNYMCVNYGTKLEWVAGAVSKEDGSEMGDMHAFPTVEQLQAATEEDLRANGFGYRAGYIAEAARQLHDKGSDSDEKGGREWLLGLRHRPFEETIEELTQLKGVGPKVAACVALFSCDKHSSIPVDTHVWKLACQRYLPSMRGKTLSPKLHPLVMEAFVNVFGEYAGWAHNALFISQLASHKHLLEGKAGTELKDDNVSRSRGSSESDFTAEERVAAGARKEAASVTATPSSKKQKRAAGQTPRRMRRKVPVDDTPSDA